MNVDFDEKNFVMKVVLMNLYFTVEETIPNDFFQEVRNSEVGKRAKMIPAPCKDNPVLNEENESRPQQKYAAVVQDMAMQWIQDHPL